MENFELIPGIIFDEEDEGCKARDFQNTPEERALIRKMANRIEHFILTEYKGRLTEIGTERSYDGKDEEYWGKLVANFEKNEGPYPYFFFTGSRTIEYHLCYEPVGFEDKNDFSLFLFFQLRNSTFHDVEDWLDGLHREHGAHFLPILETHLYEYKSIYESKWYDFIFKWFNRAISNEKSNESNIVEETEKSPGVKPSPKEKPKDKFIENFVLDETLIEGLAEILGPYFNEDDQKKLPLVLQGKIQEDGTKLHFMAPGIRFLEVFRRLHDYRKIISTKKTTKAWICKNFTNNNSKEKTKSNFKSEPVHDTLTRSDFKCNAKKAIDLSSILPLEIIE